MSLFRKIVLLIAVIVPLKYCSSQTHFQTSNFNSSCNSTAPCDPAALLTCTSGTCQCESPSSQIFVASENICKSTVGGQCSLDTPAVNGRQRSMSPEAVRHRPCIDHAECVSVTNNPANESSLSHTECRCVENYIENVYGACVAGIGQPCNYGPEECNPLAMIVCKNGRCQCMDTLQIYDVDANRCVSPAGTHCKLDTVQLGCVKNAVCYPFYYWVPPRCLCKPGYVQTPDRSCIEQPHAPHA